MTDSSHEQQRQDVALLCGPTEDQKGTRILRARQGTIEAGEIRPARDGQPLRGSELVRLHPRAEAPAVCDVEVLHADEASAKSLDRPAQVATDAYRRNWDRIFGETAASAEAAPAVPAANRLLN